MRKRNPIWIEHHENCPKVGGVKYRHAELAEGRWASMSLSEQLANVAAEIGRTISRRSKDPEMSRRAFFRALELTDLTVRNALGFTRLRELARIRELPIDHFVYGNQYETTDDYRQSFFIHFSYAAAIQRRRS